MPARILVVDDDPINRKILFRTFKSLCEVDVAVDGVDGLNKLREFRPEFIITGMHMPNLGGIDMLREVRRSYIGAGIPVLILTSDGQEKALLEAFRSGADDYVVKPFSTNEIKLRVSLIYLRQRMARDVNPLTKLPGNHMLKQEVNRRLELKEEFALAYVDLDHFKAFNDYQGFDRGDHVIQLLSDLLKDFAATYQESDVFVGHIGGDDFVLMLPVDEIHNIKKHISDQFADTVRFLFSEREFERGYYMAKNRKDAIEKFELLSVSIGVLKASKEGISDIRQIAQVSAEVKKLAKQIPGNSFFVDRRH